MNSAPTVLCNSLLWISNDIQSTSIESLIQCSKFMATLLSCVDGPSHASTCFDDVYISAINFTYSARSSISSWFIQIASIQRVLRLSGHGRYGSASARLAVTERRLGVGSPPNPTTMRFRLSFVSPHTYDKAINSLYKTRRSASRGASKMLTRISSGRDGTRGCRITSRICLPLEDSGSYWYRSIISERQNVFLSGIRQALLGHGTMALSKHC